MRIKIALSQLEPTPASPSRNVERVIDTLKSYNADLYVFPELYLTGYTSNDLIPRYSLNLDNELIKRLAEEARRESAGVIVGLAEKTNYGFIYNSAIAIGDEGVEAVFRKRHLPTFSVFDEYRWFKPYRGVLKPWFFRGVGIGVAICYDIFFPEIFKAYTLLGAKLLIVVSASPDTSVPLFHAVARARAIENTVFFAWVNMVGFFKGLGFGGSSILTAPLGRIIASLKPFEEEVGVVSIDLREIEKARINRPVVRDSCIEDAKQLLRAYELFENNTLSQKL